VRSSPTACPLDRGDKDPRQAFTILELAVTVAILAVLAALLLANREVIVASAEQAVCASRMRSIRVALDGYLQDHALVWPQGPRPQEAGWAPFWIGVLEPYGIGAKGWQCPTIRRLTRDNPDVSGSLHYIPTRFSDARNIAHRWPTHPWLIEMANAHGKGALICFPDGSIKPLARVLAEQGIR